MKKLLYLLIIAPMSIYAQSTKEVIFHSKELNKDRKLWINLPENYNSRQDSFHLVFLLDGDNQSLFNLTVASKRFLEGNSTDLSDYQTPEAIVIGIEQADNRGDDFGDDSDGKKFTAFLEKEVLPFIKNNYRTVNYSILIGHSLGARFAINFFLQHPRLFNAIIAASPAFTEKKTGQIITKFDSLFNSGLPGNRAIFLSTTYLKNDNTESDFRKFAQALKHYFEENKKAGFRFKFNSSTTLGHGKSPYFSIPEGLHFIYDPALWQMGPGDK